MLLDSNLIIYAARPEHAALRKLIAEQSPVVSAKSVVEVLGYGKLTAVQRTEFATFFRDSAVLPIDDAVIKEAVDIRQGRKLTLGDALIAATARVHGQVVLTANVDDFRGIPGLEVQNPLESA